MSINLGVLLVYLKIKKFVIAIPVSTYYLEDLFKGFVDLFDLIGWHILRKQGISRTNVVSFCQIFTLVRNTGSYDLVDIDVFDSDDGKVKIKIKVI